MNYPSSNANANSYSQAHILIEIENLVNAIAVRQSFDDAWTMSDAKSPNSDGPFYEMILQSLPRYLTLFDHQHDYSEHVELFWSACRAVGLLSEYGLRHLADTLANPTAEHVNAVTELLGWIASGVRCSQFTRCASDRCYETRRKSQKLQEYARSMHALYARELVVRVDFGYRTDCQHLITIDDVYRHLDTMINLKTSHRDIFQYEIGSAWAIEQGISKGYHIHAAYYFPGSKHQNGWFMAKQIGELWEGITGGRGTYHSCNAEEAHYESLGLRGTGMIHRDDPFACENAIRTVGYLASPDKEDQYLRMKPRGRRAFATGIAPKANGTGGRTWRCIR